MPSQPKNDVIIERYAYPLMGAYLNLIIFSKIMELRYNRSICNLTNTYSICINIQSAIATTRESYICIVQLPVQNNQLHSCYCAPALD